MVSHTNIRPLPYCGAVPSRPWITSDEVESAVVAASNANGEAMNLAENEPDASDPYEGLGMDPAFPGGKLAAQRIHAAWAVKYRKACAERDAAFERLQEIEEDLYNSPQQLSLV